MKQLQVLPSNNLKRFTDEKAQMNVIAENHKRTSTETTTGSNRRSCSAWSHAEYMPNKPEVLLRNDDLLIPVAADVFDTSLCSNERELLPFVNELHHRAA